MAHHWHQDFIDTGKWEGRMTCLQGWKCKLCKTVLSIPLNLNPKDYEETLCIPPPPPVKEKWKAPMKQKEVNKRDYPAQKQTRS